MQFFSKIFTVFAFIREKKGTIRKRIIWGSIQQNMRSVRINLIKLGLDLVPLQTEIHFLCKLIMWSISSWPLNFADVHYVLYFYRPQTKLREGNVFTHVCLSRLAGAGRVSAQPKCRPPAKRHPPRFPPAAGRQTPHPRPGGMHSLPARRHTPTPRYGQPVGGTILLECILVLELYLSDIFIKYIIFAMAIATNRYDRILHISCLDNAQIIKYFKWWSLYILIFAIKL